MSSDLVSSLAFDDVLIDFAGRRVLRAGRVIALEPKAFDVLALLARTPGHALTRDQILDAVWGHRHVTPGVLNRIMTLLRHALGEEAQAPRYLHTLHGVGYRFDLPEASVVANGTHSLTDIPDQSELPGAPSVPEPEDRADLSDANAGSQRSESASIASHLPARLRPLLWREFMAVALSLSVLLLILAWWHRDTADSSPPARSVAAAQPPTLIVMPLKPIGDTALDREIAAGLSDELITELARIPGLRVIARESTGLATAQSLDIAALIPRLNVSHALEGSLRQSGEQLRVHIRLTQASSGRTLWAQDYDRKAVDVLALQRDIARAVAAALTLKLGLATGPAAKGGDAEFLRRYFAAQAMLRISPNAEPEILERAEAQFRSLTRLRPEDGRAHAGLALTLEMRAFVRPALADGLRGEAAQEAALALTLDPTLADAYRVQAAAACRVNHWQQCLQGYQRARALAPSSAQVNFQYALALAALGYLDRAELIMRESMERDPLNPTWHFGYGRILDTLGRHDEARSQFALSEPFSPYARWFNAVWRRDYSEAADIAQAMGQAGVPNDYEQILKPAYVAVSRALKDPTLWPLAEAPMRKFEQQTGLKNFLHVLSPDPDAADLIARLEIVRERSYSSWDLLLWTKDLAFLRKDPAFQEYLRENGILAYWRQNGFPRQCRARGDGAACD